MTNSAPTENGKKVLTMAEYIKNPISGKLRGVTYEDGKIIDVHIRDTDDVVKVFVPVRHGRWIFGELGPVGCDVNCSECGWGAKNVDPVMWLDYDGHKHCGCCGAKMDGGKDDENA